MHGERYAAATPVSEHSSVLRAKDDLLHASDEIREPDRTFFGEASLA